MHFRKYDSNVYFVRYIKQNIWNNRSNTVESSPILTDLFCEYCKKSQNAMVHNLDSADLSEHKCVHHLHRMAANIIVSIWQLVVCVDHHVHQRLCKYFHRVICNQCSISNSSKCHNHFVYLQFAYYGNYNQTEAKFKPFGWLVKLFCLQI